MSTTNLLIFGVVVLWALARGSRGSGSSEETKKEKPAPVKRGPDLLTSLMVFFLLMLLVLESVTA